jgi:succinate-semialdehyde dehydrogenase/glutarate-semialdehyde dehydrogenase
MPICSHNPATGETTRKFDELTAAQIEQALARCADAFEVQKTTDFAERRRRLHKAAQLLEAEAPRWGRVISEEMGKTLSAAVAEVKKCALVCRYYADHGERQLADEEVATDASRSLRKYLPIGPVLAVMPWNFPFWQVFRFAAPALMAGNTGLLKHASNVPQSALAIEDILKRAGFDAGEFQTLLISSGKVAGLLADARVRAATLTGSGAAGAAVAASAGRHIKKTVLELGGSDPFIVMPSADFDDAVATAVTARVQNNGQSCIAAKRFIVHKDIYGAFRDAFVSRMDALKVGDPMHDDTDIGPLATQQGRADCDALVRRLLEEGNRRLSGAQIIDGQGYFYQPGVVEIDANAAPAFDEEIFGPVALLYRATSLEHAIEIANATPFGLGSTIFTRDDKQIATACDGLDAGATFVNTMVASNPHLPFGGVKTSGYGRELAREGIREFTNIKTIYIK